MTNESTTTSTPEDDDAVDPEEFPGGERMTFEHHGHGIVLQPILGFHPFFILESKEGEDETLVHSIAVGGGPANKEHVLQWLEIVRQLIVDEVIPAVKAHEETASGPGEEGT